MPSKVSNRYNSRLTSCNWRSVLATAAILPPLPHSAFDHGSRYVIRAEVPYRLNERVHPIRAGHRPRSHLAEDFELILAKIRGRYLVPRRVVHNVEAE